MTFRFPLTDVTIQITRQVPVIAIPLYADKYIQVNQLEFSMHIPGVAWYYACNGNSIEVQPYDHYNRATLELYLNGSVYGAILHQRHLLPLHGSSFSYHSNGILVCGESGAGKSSTTAAFSLNGATFLTDDVTPLLITNNAPLIWAMSDRIKLWYDSLVQLKKNKTGLDAIDATTEKYYLPVSTVKGNYYPLKQIFLLEQEQQAENVVFQQVGGMNKFAALRNEIYRKEYLAGMPACEAHYFQQIAVISNTVSVTKVVRPKNITITEFCSHLEAFMRDKNYQPV